MKKLDWKVTKNNKLICFGNKANVLIHKMECVPSTFNPEHVDMKITVFIKGGFTVFSDRFFYHKDEHGSFEERRDKVVIDEVQDILNED